MKNLKKFVCNLDVIISGLSLCAIVVITLAGVIMRKIMNQPIAWLEEMQLLLFIYAIFFGGSVAFRYGNQVSIDLVMNRLKGKAARVLEIFDVVVTVIVLIYYCYGGYQLMSSVTKKVTPYFKINYAFIDVAAPIGMILMAIQYIVYTYRHLKGLGNPGHDSGLIHIHDMDFLPMGTTTCCQIDLNDLFKDGFSTGRLYIAISIKCGMW